MWGIKRSRDILAHTYAKIPGETFGSTRGGGDTCSCFAEHLENRKVEIYLIDNCATVNPFMQTIKNAVAHCIKKQASFGRTRRHNMSHPPMLFYVCFFTLHVSASMFLLYMLHIFIIVFSQVSENKIWEVLVRSSVFSMTLNNETMSSIATTRRKLCACCFAFSNLSAEPVLLS